MKHKDRTFEANDEVAPAVTDIGHNIVQDAFLIAVEEQARQRLQRLSALKRITPVDMSQLSVELNRRKRAQVTTENRQERNGYIANSSVYVTSINEDGAIESKPTISSPKQKPKSLPSKSAPIITNGIQEERTKEPVDAVVENKPESEKHHRDLNEKSTKWEPEKKANRVDSSDASELSEVKEVNKSDLYSVAREHLNNGRVEKLLGEQPDNRIRATAIVESNKLGVGEKG
ncbi:hypothetical protein EVAR_6278_1 [Eumeta japonica]|uniref:Uncharacterized protein n=1 Tax=Eumeta variegata TaxID=151549 RepID=A0A4C1TAX5_EUMVA|nr:hypothetical protein EVAR_6278_1 [Eumeta japonica]